MTDRDTDPIAACAVAAVASALSGRTVPGPDHPDLDRVAACFVTIERDGRLRGCIGSLRAVRTLRVDIAHNAVAALKDPRLPAVTVDEWPDLAVSVSVLSDTTPLTSTDPDGIRDELRPGVDGLVLRSGTRRATFLPTVWRTFPRPGPFLAALAAKGGWSVDEWPTDVTAERYTTSGHASLPPRPPLEGL